MGQWARQNRERSNLKAAGRAIIGAFIIDLLLLALKHYLSHA